MKKHKSALSPFLASALLSAISANDYTENQDGSITTSGGITAKGEYFDRTNGGEWVRTENLIPTEGLAHILNVALGTTPKPASYHLALFSAAAQPAANWTAASFASTASEIVSMTEGYSSATRPTWTPTNTSTGSIDNMAAVAKVTMKTNSSLTVQGAAMLTSSAKGGTTGALISASKYASPRVFQDGDTYEIGYRISLTV